LPSSPEIARLIKGENIKIDKRMIKAKDLTYKEKGKKNKFYF